MTLLLFVSITPGHGELTTKYKKNRAALRKDTHEPTTPTPLSVKVLSCWCGIFYRYTLNFKSPSAFRATCCLQWHPHQPAGHTPNDFQYSILFWRESEVPRHPWVFTPLRRQSACPKPHLLSLSSALHRTKSNTYIRTIQHLPSCSTRLRSPAFPHHANMQSIFITKCPSEHNGPSTTRYNHLQENLAHRRMCPGYFFDPTYASSPLYGPGTTK